MDPVTRTNLLLFLGATLVLAACWLFLSGIAGGGVVQWVVGAGCALGAVWVFRLVRR